MPDSTYEADVIIVGGGIAGITTALELLERKHRVLLLDRDTADQFGGLARWSFGGIFFVDTPQQRLAGIKDSPALALQDWHSFAEFEDDATWPKRWAEQYVHRCREDVYRWLRGHGLSFFPVVHWVERGLYQPGNSVPRFHMVWGTGKALTETLIDALRAHPHADGLTLRFRHHVTDLITEGDRVTGVQGTNERTGTSFRAKGGQTVIAAGGICGDIDRLKQHWYDPWGDPPETVLNGSHRYADGTMHDAAADVGARVTHMDKHWLYAAGVHHPDPEGTPYDALSIVPPKSALWVNHRGERIGPNPLVSGYDTRYLVERIGAQEKQYSWQVMNWTIAAKELAISGSEYNAAIRDKKPVEFLKRVLGGDDSTVRDLAARCPDVVVADTLEALVAKMNACAGTDDVDADLLRDTIDRYDQQIARGPTYHNDEQLRRIAHLRQYRGDRSRTCNFQPILDPDAKPLVAIRAFILSRKSLGGLQTDLDGRVLARPEPAGTQDRVDGLWAVGEAAGFGGGGIHGLRSLEGTFLGTCLLGGRLAAQAIAAGG
jgi:predicted oxidoreductase